MRILDKIKSWTISAVSIIVCAFIYEALGWLGMLALFFFFIALGVVWLCWFMFVELCGGRCPNCGHRLRSGKYVTADFGGPFTIHWLSCNKCGLGVEVRGNSAGGDDDARGRLKTLAREERLRSGMDWLTKVFNSDSFIRDVYLFWSRSQNNSQAKIQYFSRTSTVKSHCPVDLYIDLEISAKKMQKRVRSELEVFLQNESETANQAASAFLSQMALDIGPAHAKEFASCLKQGDDDWHTLLSRECMQAVIKASQR